MEKYINISDVIQVLKNNGYSWNGKQYDQNLQNILPVTINDLNNFNNMRYISGIVTNITDKSGISYTTSISADEYHLLIGRSILDFTDISKQEEVFVLIADLSEQWIMHLAEKYPKYVTFAKKDLNKKEKAIKNEIENLSTKDNNCKNNAKVVNSYKNTLSKIQKTLNLIEIANVNSK